MAPDDRDIPASLRLAQEAGMDVNIHTGELRDAHPNTAVIAATNAEGRTITVSASSLGGGRIRINAIDGMEATFSGEYPTLIIRNEDKPGMVSKVTQILGESKANIATLQLYRDRRGGLAVMVIECDDPLPQTLLDLLSSQDGIVRCTYLDREEK